MNRRGWDNATLNAKKMAEDVVSANQGSKLLDKILDQKLDNSVSYLRMIDLTLIDHAPEEWDFYDSLSHQKFYELLESIYQKGILQSLTLWEKPDGRYYALAGNHRLKASRAIYEVSNDPDRRYVPAIVKGINEIDENEAREIVIDTNWASRDLSVMEKAKSIYHKYILLQGKRSKKGTGRLDDKIASQYNIGRGLVNDLKNLMNIHDVYYDAINDNVVSISAASIVAKFEDEIQQYLYDNYIDSIKVGNMKKIQNLDSVTTSQIDRIMSSKKLNSLSIKFDHDMSKIFDDLNSEEKASLNNEINTFVKQWFISNKRLVE